jgi:hypothetical protein
MESDSENSDLRAVRLKLAKLEVEFLTFVKASIAAMSQIAGVTATGAKNNFDVTNATVNALESLSKRTAAIESTLRSYGERRPEVRRGAKT